MPSQRSPATGMTVTFLGTCGGTEPMPGCHHCSIAVEHAGGLYWFDAGESCSYTAHLAGLDIPATQAIFISHSHMDHIGGLPNLLWTINKLAKRSSAVAERMTGRGIPVILPRMDVWEAARTFFIAGEGEMPRRYEFAPSLISDGAIYERNGLRVIARHNLHLGAPADGLSWQSYSFRIEADGKSLLFSGDVRGVSDIAEFASGCDLLIMETGHHDVERVTRELEETGVRFGKLAFTHHGRAILKDRDEELAKARAILGDKVLIAHDGMRMDVK